MPIEIESPEQIGYGTIRNNLSESSYTDALLEELDPGFGSLNKLSLCYGDHAGHPGLRELVAAGSPVLGKEDVMLTIGAAAGLFIVATSLLEKGDEMIVVRPNYSTNIATPIAIGASVKYIDLYFETGFRMDMAAVKKAVGPRTRYISVTHPHNPTGVCLGDQDMRELAAIAEQNGIWLLVDETYRDLVFQDKLPVACDYSDRVISVSSLSKACGLPGIRMGWIQCQDKALMEGFLAAKEQIHICGSSLDEELAYRYFKQKAGHMERIRQSIAGKFALLKDWMDRQDGLEWVEPRGGVVCFPRIKDPAGVDIDRFYAILLQQYGTYTGPGHWFDQPRHYMRIGYGWPEKERLLEGLESITKSLSQSRF